MTKITPTPLIKGVIVSQSVIRTPPCFSGPPKSKLAAQKLVLSLRLLLSPPPALMPCGDGAHAHNRLWGPLVLCIQYATSGEFLFRHPLGLCPGRQIAAQVVRNKGFNTRVWRRKGV